MTINQLIQDSKKQAKTCAKNAVRFKRCFIFLAWADVVLGPIGLAWGLFIMISSLEQAKLLPAIGGMVVIGIGFMWLSSIPRHFREARQQFDHFMVIRQRVLDNMKALEELKQELGGDFDNNE